MPVHVAASVDKNGVKRAAHMSRRRKRVETSPMAHTETPSQLDTFIGRHGGPAHLKDTLEKLTPEQRAKLIDAMAHMEGIDHDGVMSRLDQQPVPVIESVIVPEPVPKPPSVLDYFAEVKKEYLDLTSKLDAALGAGAITIEQHADATAGAARAGAAGALAALNPPMKTFGWDAVKLSDAYTEEELLRLQKVVQGEHANPFGIDGSRYYENSNPTLNLYNKSGRKKLDKIAMAMFYRMGERKKRNEVELAEDRADLADEMHNNPGGPRAKELMEKIILAEAGHQASEHHEAASQTHE